MVVKLHRGLEAEITIGNTALNRAQSMTVRVAVGSMLMDLEDPKYRDDLGEIAENYEANLREIQRLIMENTDR